MTSEFSRMTADVTDAIVEIADLQPGQKVLDLAGGTGEPSLTVAKKIGPDGTVYFTDYVPAMVETARQNAEKAGVSNMTFEQVDAHNIPYGDGEFERVVARFGVMFFPETQTALAEIKRVLRPGGKAAFTVWAPADQNPNFLAVNSVLGAKGLMQPPEP